MGVNFYMVRAGEGISDTYTDEIIDDAKSTYSMNVDEVVNVECSAKPQGDDGVGLWQWVVTSEDQESSVLSVHTVCRYGTDYNKPPKCPWNACLNGECTVCASDWMD